MHVQDFIKMLLNISNYFITVSGFKTFFCFMNMTFFNHLFKGFVIGVVLLYYDFKKVVVILVFENPSVEKIKEILENSKTIAVVGLSDNPERTSYMVSEAMQRMGYQIIPVNPNANEILGETCYPTLTDIKEPVDIVNVFRRSEHIVPISEETVRIKAKVLWLQQGIVNEEAAGIAMDKGIEVIMDRCIKVMAAIYLR